MRIAGCGCALGDFIYDGISFDSREMAPLRSRVAGDGGISPGALVFVEDFERFVGQPYRAALQPVLGDRQPDWFNVGGPAIVTLIMAAQLLAAEGISVEFYGARGNDEIGKQIIDLVRQTPLHTDHYISRSGSSPMTLVLSDPNYDQGHGERAFINQIGVAGQFGPNQLPDTFFEAGIVLFGATAVVPQLHVALTELVARAKQHECIVVVTTVYDFLSENRRPGEKWPLVDDPHSWRQIDLLITDSEEAQRITGSTSTDGTIAEFREHGLSACIITNGPHPVAYYAEDESLFHQCSPTTLPVSEAAREKAVSGNSGDTTGCGDNFAGGVLAAIALQRQREERKSLDLASAVALGICAGGNALFHLGGVKLETRPGECLADIKSLYQLYRQQVAELIALPELP